MPGGAEGSHCSANEPANVTGHGSASQQSDSVVNALKVTLLLWYSPCKTSCVSLNTCVLSWQHPRGHHRDVAVISGVVFVRHSLHLWTVCFLGGVQPSQPCWFQL